jgi:Icc-related predicted phosphoesterase
MLFVGDVHGKFDEYFDLIEGHPSSIQVGDFGLGFPETLPEDIKGLERCWENGDHRFVLGNHDNPEVCRTQPNFIPSGIDVATGIFCLGGATSVDRESRIPGVSWWEEEEHSYEELMHLINAYEEAKPSVVVAHECPDAVARTLFRWYTDSRCESRTRQALETCFQLHKPDLFVFGHWHESRRRNILGTEFICLAELECIEIDI